MRLIIIILISLTFVFQSTPTSAYWGARPMGMGGAYTGVADDAYAAYWNPAGFAINPGIDLTGCTLITGKNRAIGDNLAAFKMNLEAPMNSPFDWIAGVGVVSGIALLGAKYLADQGIVKKGWGRPGEVVSREASMADMVEKSGDEKTVSRQPAAQSKPAPAEVHHYYGPPMPFMGWRWYRGDYRRPTYWDDRYRGPQREYAPAHQAQFALGLTWLHDNNSVLNQDANWYTASVATAWEERVALGVNLNLYDLRIPSNNVKGFGAGLDLGGLIRPVDSLAFGIVAKEVLTTDIRWQNGAITRYEMQINAGLALKPVEYLTVAADIHNLFEQGSSAKTYHYGAELRPVPGVAFRGGLYDGQKTAGASVMFNDLILDYTILGGSFARTQMAGATWKF